MRWLWEDFVKMTKVSPAAVCVRVWNPPHRNYFYRRHRLLKAPRLLPPKRGAPARRLIMHARSLARSVFIKQRMLRAV